MKNESIDDIFEGIDLNDEELLKEAEEVENFKVSEDNKPIKSTTQNSKQNIISAEYFYDLSNQIKNDPDYMHIKDLIANRHYDRFYNDDLKEKYELKKMIFSKINNYRYNEKTSEAIEDIVNTLNDLKSNELFIGDYLPYKSLMEFYTRTGHHNEALMVINDFLKSDIYVNDIILSAFKYYSEYLHERLGLNNEMDLDNYFGNLLCRYPLCDQIFYQRNTYYSISDEKYEFNQSLIFLLDKAINSKYLESEEAIKFFVNLTECDILYFEALAYSMLGYFCARMNSSEKFHDYYRNALKLRKEQGNILEEDFNRIFSCAQIEIDLEHGSMQTVEDQFNELFSGEFRRK